MTTRYQCNLLKATFISLCDKSAPEPNKRSKKLNGDWTAEFSNQMSSVESVEFQLKPTTARFNENAKRSDSNYFTAYATCKAYLCPCKYTIVLNKLTDEQYLSFQIQRQNEHDHNVHPEQIRGSERHEVAKIVLTEFNGSSKAFLDTMAGRGVENIGGAERIRKIVSEEINQNMVSTCFITNLLAAIDMSNITITGTISTRTML